MGQQADKRIIKIAQEELSEIGLVESFHLGDDSIPTIPECIWERYEKLSQIGGGGFGEVFKAQKKYLNKTVALKLLRHEHLKSLTHIARFWAEARIMGVLGKEQFHIVPVLDMGRSDDDQYFIEMEFIEGGRLDRKLIKDGPLSQLTALDLLRQLAVALQHAHTHNVIHRDIKPQNVIVADSGRLTLVDFGIAKQLGHVGISTETGFFLGSFHYAAPEQWDRARFGEISERTDIYSLGILGYHLLAGKLPYEGTTSELIQKHCLEDLPEFPPYLNLSNTVASFIEKCVEKRQSDRFVSMQEVHNELITLLSSSKDEMAPTRIVTSPSIAPSKRRQEVATISEINFYAIEKNGKHAVRTIITSDSKLRFQTQKQSKMLGIELFDVHLQVLNRILNVNTSGINTIVVTPFENNVQMLFELERENINVEFSRVSFMSHAPFQVFVDIW